MEHEVEFNNGFVTALALFYGHREDISASRILGQDTRIYPASDHLCDIEYPENLDKDLKKKIEEFVKDVFEVRLKKISINEGSDLFDRCKDLLMEIDEKCFGLKVVVNYP